MLIFEEPSRQDLPTSQFEDVRHAAVKGLLSLLPGVGGPASELMGLLSSPLAQRRDDWFTDLARRLWDLEGRVRGFHFEDLDQNEQFISATQQATLSAMRTHQAEKLDALKNAVLNVATGHESEDRQTNFIALVDRFTPAHLKVLHKFHQPPVNGGYMQWQMRSTLNKPIGPPDWIQEFVPDLAGEDQGFFRMLICDLYNAGLSQVKPEDAYIPREMTWTTAFGADFLRFIAPPVGTPS